jgi:exopolysaccharide production protein ExoQ
MSLSIQHDAILDPDRNMVFAVPAVALSVWVFAYSTIFGQVSILLLYALWLPLPLLRPAILGRAPGVVVAILALPGLAALSVLWSDATQATLRAAVQYGSTVVCGLIAARVVSLRNLARGGLAGGLAVLAYSWSDGSYGYDFVDASFAFQGAFQSKNQLGFHASLTMLFGLSVGLMSGTPVILRLAALAGAAFAVQTVILADSATSVLSLAAGLMAALLVTVVMRVDGAARVQVIVLVFGLGVGVAALAIRLGAFDSIFVIFGKDPTLTGRTFLWNQGILFGEERPLRGLGYAAFWLQGRPEAEQLWQDFYITARTGFHFHNTLIEAFVALGLVGAAMVAGWTIALMVLAMRLTLNAGHRAGAAVSAALAVIFVIRSFVEIDFFTPYTAGSFMVPYLLLRMADMRGASIAPEPQGVPA